MPAVIVGWRTAGHGLRPGANGDPDGQPRAPAHGDARRSRRHPAMFPLAPTGVEFFPDTDPSRSRSKSRARSAPTSTPATRLGEAPSGASSQSDGETEAPGQRKNDADERRRGWRRRASAAARPAPRTAASPSPWWTTTTAPSQSSVTLRRIRSQLPGNPRHRDLDHEGPERAADGRAGQHRDLGRGLPRDRAHRAGRQGADPARGHAGGETAHSSWPASWT